MLKINNKSKVDKARGKTLQISREALVGLFIKEKSEVADTELTIVTRIALPKDWTAGNIYWNLTTRVFEIAIFSKEFPAIKEGAIYPLLDTEEETLIDIRRWECKERKEKE